MFVVDFEAYSSASHVYRSLVASVGIEAGFILKQVSKYDPNMTQSDGS